MYISQWRAEHSAFGPTIRQAVKWVHGPIRLFPSEKPQITRKRFRQPFGACRAMKFRKGQGHPERGPGSSGLQLRSLSPHRVELKPILVTGRAVSGYGGTTTWPTPKASTRLKRYPEMPMDKQIRVP